MSTKASGSITITRMKNGDTLTFSLVSSRPGKPWVQFVETDSGTCKPDWSSTSDDWTTHNADRPYLTPKVVSSSGAVVTLTDHQWTYNGDALTFNGATQGDWTLNTDSKYPGYFAINVEDGSIKPMQNLATTDSPADDIIEYTGTAIVNKHGQTVKGSFVVRIAPSGSSAYIFTLDAEDGNTMLSESRTSMKIYPRLYQGGGEVTSASFKWTLRGSQTQTGTGSYFTVSREFVDYVAVVECEASVGSDTVIASIIVNDVADEYCLEPYLTDKVGNTSTVMTDDNTSVKLRARLRNLRTGNTTDLYSREDVTYDWQVYDKGTSKQVTTGNTKEFILTNAVVDAADATDMTVLVSATIAGL